MEIVSVDIGGTHARFALAEVAEGRVVSLGEPVTLKTAEYAGFQTAWEAFGTQLGRALPRAAAIAVASPISGDVIKLTNNPWVIRPPLLKERLHVDSFVLINDFGAVGQAEAAQGADAPSVAPQVGGDDAEVAAERLVHLEPVQARAGDPAVEEEQRRRPGRARHLPDEGAAAARQFDPSPEGQRWSLRRCVLHDDTSFPHQGRV